MLAERTSFFRVITRVVQVLATLAHPIGMFAVLAVGIHVGSDRIDDLLFSIFSEIDGLLDSLAAFVIRGVGSIFSASEDSIERWIFGAAELVDVDLKSELARWGALVVELLVDFLLAIPVFLHETGPLRLRMVLDALHNVLRDPTVLRVTMPLTTLATAIAGAIAVSREVEVAVHARLTDSPLLARAPAIAMGFGLVALVLIGWRVVPRLCAGAVADADRRARNDRVSVLPEVTRRMRGWKTAVFAVPVSVLALWATPFAGTVRALLSW